MEELNPIRFGVVRAKPLANHISKLSTGRWIDNIIIDQQRFDDEFSFWKDRPNTSFWKHLEK